MKELDKLLTDKNNEIKFLKLENELLKNKLKEKEHEHQREIISNSN